MALKVLLLRSKSEKLQRALEDLKVREQELADKEKELEEAIKEMDENTTEEERAEVERQAEEQARDVEELKEKKTELEEEIAELEEQIKEEEEKQEPPQTTEPPKPDNGNTRKAGAEMSTRMKFFGMDTRERGEFLSREDVQEFLTNVRTCIKEKRALTNVGLTIPEVVLPLIRQVSEETSKLMKYVTVRPVGGTSRQNIMGEIPEAFWDEMCASLKELDLTFYNMEMDGYKVSGYFAVCNAVLEDSDVNLATELINAIGKAIGKAIDKAILYGKDTKMPMGIVTSLTTATAPSTYPATGRTWEDLSTSHVITGKATEGLALFKEVIAASGAIDNDYDTGAIVWVMNKKTHAKLLAESLGANSAATIVAGMNNTMPVVGGDIVELKYIPDDTIIFGYFKNYVLAERAGTKLDRSEHARFIEDQTVFRGTARYDGDLAIREAFAIFGLGKAPVTDAPAFAGE